MIEEKGLAEVVSIRIWRSTSVWWKPWTWRSGEWVELKNDLSIER